MLTDLHTEPSRPAEVQQQLRGPRPGRPEVVATTVAEATGTPGLVITPRLRKQYPGRWAFTGEWNVWHQPSGHIAITAFGANLGHARDLAALLGELAVDWTQPFDRLPLRGLRASAAVNDIRERLERAVADDCPLRTTQSSWGQVPPEYWVGTADEPDEFFASFDHAAEYVLEAQPFYDPDELIVGRCASPSWHLYCASDECLTPLTDEYPVLHRADAADLARDEGWRRLDFSRWLCRTCSAQFAGVPRW